MLKRIQGYFLLSAFVLFACQPDEQITTEDAPDIDTNDFTEETSSLSEDVDAYKTILNLVKETDQEQNFLIKPSNIPDVKAYVDANNRFLAYSPDFIKKIKDIETGKKDWVAVGLLTHEMGHHLAKHELINGEASSQEILEADKYVGFIYYQLGVPIDTAKAAMSMVIDSRKSTNVPSKDSRLNAMSIGFQDALTLDQKVDTLIEESLIAIANADENVKVQVVKIDTPEIVDVDQVVKKELTEEEKEAELLSSFAYKCVFIEDSSLYYIDHYDQISSYRNSKFLVVGYKSASNKPGFDWVFAANDDKHGVDMKGRIWSRSSEGKFIIIGHVYKM